MENKFTHNQSHGLKRWALLPIIVLVFFYILLMTGSLNKLMGVIPPSKSNGLQQEKHTSNQKLLSDHQLSERKIENEFAERQGLIYHQSDDADLLAYCRRTAFPDSR